MAQFAQHNQRVVLVEDAGPNPQFSVQETKIPTYGDDEVLIQLAHTGLCHTDVAFAYGEWQQLGFGMSDGNCTPGHEGVGHVVAVGSNVANLKVGDRVGTKWLRRVCAECAKCKGGNEHLCRTSKIYGQATAGSLQQYVPSQASITPKIPEEIPLENAGPLLCAGVTIFRGVKQSGAVRGDWIVISGAGGGLGHLGVQFASKMGIKIVGIDAGNKKDFCLSLGVDHFIDFQTTPDVAKEVGRITDGGAKGVLVPVGTRSSYEQACRMLALGGTLVCIGLPSGSCTLPLELIDIISSGYTVTGVNASSLKHIDETLEFAARHKVWPKTQLIPMDNVQEAFELVRDGKAQGRIVLDLK
ncbi:alcohol dehydrogenase [Knufia peltigerae]|uniref:alcohol dehydrogenase n=1 Tax=Knufia peltigerae TaxID=1002370 RepID=A0AA38XU98_9EURO|nr:alcohol dehydrogenase [Knufia peltigerae]